MVGFWAVVAVLGIISAATGLAAEATRVKVTFIIVSYYPSIYTFQLLNFDIYAGL